MALLRTGFTDLFFSTALALVEDVIMEQYGNKPDMINQIFNVESSDKWGEQDTTITGFGVAPAKSENAPVTYDDIYMGYDKTYTHTTYALAFRVSKEMIDDEKWGLITKASKALGRSMYNTRQIQAASVLNNAFDSGYTGPDSKELCATDHPLIGGGTLANELSTAADLSVTSLRSAFNGLEDQTDERGLMINVQPRYLVIPNELLWDAEELLKSSLKPDTSNNAVNAFQVKNVNYLVWNYLTDADAWFLIGDKADHNLKFYDREAVNVSSDYDFENDASKTKIRTRFSYGWSDYRGVYGSPGA